MASGGEAADGSIEVKPVKQKQLKKTSSENSKKVSFNVQKPISKAPGGEASRGSLDVKPEKKKKNKKKKKKESCRSVDRCENEEEEQEQKEEKEGKKKKAAGWSIDVKTVKQKQMTTKTKTKKVGEEDLQIEGYLIRGVSIAGRETCVILPSLNLAFDIGKCPERAVSQQFLLISHGHMDHIGGLPMYVATRGFQKMAPPTIIVPKVIKENVEKVFEAHRAMDHSELAHNLVGLDVGEEFFIRRDLKVRAFRTYHLIPSQGYIVYSVTHRLKQEYVGLPGAKLATLRKSGVEITDAYTTPEIAFTGDTMSDFITDADNADVLRTKILIMESTYLENSCTVEDARFHGHTHLSEIISNADRFQNKAILLIHFSARYHLEVIENAVSALPPPLGGRVFALTSGFCQKD